MPYVPTETTTRTTEQARQGEAPGHVRYVLGGSLVLAVLAGLFLYIFYF